MGSYVTQVECKNDADDSKKKWVKRVPSPDASMIPGIDTIPGPAGGCGTHTW